MLAEAQDSPWTHLAALEWAADGRNGDPALAAQEFEALRARCPGDLRAFQYLGSLRDPQKLSGQVTALRNAIETRKKLGFDESEVELFRTAWTWERVTYGESRLDEFKRAVRGDVEFLREHLNYDSAFGSLWSRTVTKTYQGRHALKTIEDEVLRRAPNGQAAWWIKKERWEEQNPPPKQTPPQPNQPIPPSDMAASEAYRKSHTDFMLSLMEQFWGKPYAAFEAAHIMARKTCLMAHSSVWQTLPYRMPNVSRTRVPVGRPCRFTSLSNTCRVRCALIAFPPWFSKVSSRWSLRRSTAATVMPSRRDPRSAPMTTFPSRAERARS